MKRMRMIKSKKRFCHDLIFKCFLILAHFKYLREIKFNSIQSVDIKLLWYIKLFDYFKIQMSLFSINSYYMLY